jgi:hypothetical protein
MKEKVLGVPKAVWQRLANDTIIGTVLYALWLAFFSNN